MKNFLTIITLLGGMSASVAQEAAAPEAVVEAASAQQAASGVPRDERATPPVDVVSREGYVYKMQECGENGGASSRFGNILSTAFLQVSKKSGVDLLAGYIASEAAGNAAGQMIEGEGEKRKVCVTVAFKDGTPDQATVLSGSTYDALKLRYRQTVAVRFEDGKPVFPW